MLSHEVRVRMEEDVDCRRNRNPNSIRPERAERIGGRSILQRTTSHNSLGKGEEEGGGHRLNRKRSQRIIENRATTDRSPSFLPQKFPPTRSRYDSHGTKRSSIRDRPRNRPIAAREETRWKGLRSEPPPTVYTLYTVETSVGSFSFESAAVAFDDRINWQIGATFGFDARYDLQDVWPVVSLLTRV